VALAGIGATAAVRAVHTWRSPTTPIVFSGAILRDDPNPGKQTPIGNVKLTVRPALVPGRQITMSFEHAGYKPVELEEADSEMLYVVRMEPVVRENVSLPDNSRIPVKIRPTVITNVRVRYSFKNQTTMNVGSVAKQYEVVNQGNVPCMGHKPCSPDGKWKASVGLISLDAEKGTEYSNVRVSCIAGPCPFTKLEPDELPRPVRSIRITVLDWSDTASFLLEAEVTRIVTGDLVRQSFPFITGQTMSFALPPTAEGMSAVADLDGEEIIFPLGPNLNLSWATCSVQVVPGGNKIYRCELKPGYVFQQ
jgi:hypothetical protein